VHPKLEWTHHDPHMNRRLMTLWLSQMAWRGVLLHPSGWNVSLAHTTRDVEKSLRAAVDAFQICQCALEKDDWSLLDGVALIEENPFRPTGVSS